MMGSVWREEGQQCADRMAAGIPFQTAGHEQAIILNGLQDVHLQIYIHVYNHGTLSWSHVFTFQRAISCC